LDLTLVGDEVIGLFKVHGFFVPGVHSRPVSEQDPDIAPALIPLRETLMVLTGRPVNIQASRDLVMHVRGDLLDQPYLTLIKRPDRTCLFDCCPTTSSTEAPAARRGWPGSSGIR